MKKLIAIDNGHGINTPGKRTPTFPDGKIIKEWQFNHPAAKKLGKLLRQNGFDVIYVSDTEEDTSLSVRTKKANDVKADMFVSIHFNALTGSWGAHGGIETYHYPNSTKGKELADLVQKELINETKLRDRGVKSANFQVLRETNMSSILVECGFMDNIDEAKLMLDENYQIKCARAVAKGICKYFGVEFKEEIKNQDLIKINLHGKDFEIEGILKDKTNYIPIRFLERLGYKVEWKDGKIYIDYKEDK